MPNAWRGFPRSAIATPPLHKPISSAAGKRAKISRHEVWHTACPELVEELALSEVTGAKFSRRAQIERAQGKKLFLELFVKARPGWNDSSDFVEGLDWRRQLEDIAAREQFEKNLE